MQFITLILGLLGLFTLALSVSTTSGDLPYPLEVLQYEGYLGGHQVQLNGTVQEIYAQMQVLHPDFDPENPGFAPGFDEKNLTSRAALNKGALICCPIAGQLSWGTRGAYPAYINQGIKYLNGLGRINQNGHKCTRISCSYGSGIWFCNDNAYAIQPAAIYLATYAYDLEQNCLDYEVNIDNPTVCGQEFDTDNYNIIVRAADC